VSSPPGLEFASFWRTFAWLMLLVVLPSAGLSGFGVLAIINERAAVEKRLEAAWGGRLERLEQRLLEALPHNAPVESGRLGPLVQSLGSEESGGEPVRFELQPLFAPARSDTGTAAGLVGKLVSEVERARTEALAARPLAWRPLPPPLQAYRLAAVPLDGDPVAAASLRNRVLYGVLLGLFYVALAVGTVYVARTLHREARLSRMKTDFVSLVSHELRTPLTSIRMFIETLSLGRVTDPAETREVLSLLSQETARLSEMIERVLDWGRIESGRRTWAFSSTPVQQVVDGAVAAFHAQRLGEKVDLGVEVEPGLPAIRVDREAVAGALLNLVQNAFKYTGEDKRIRVRARRERKGVAIEVQDNGPGIPPRERKRVFERFYRVDGLLTRRTEGSGLGLSIAQKIAEAHGGSLTLQSELGVGSCFTLHLPAEDET